MAMDISTVCAKYMTQFTTPYGLGRERKPNSSLISVCVCLTLALILLSVRPRLSTLIGRRPLHPPLFAFCFIYYLYSSRVRVPAAAAPHRSAALRKINKSQPFLLCVCAARSLTWIRFYIFPSRCQRPLPFCVSRRRHGLVAFAACHSARWCCVHATTPFFAARPGRQGESERTGHTDL